MARKKKKDDEELLDLSVDLQTDSEDRFSRFAQWQQRYTWTMAGIFLLLAILGVSYFWRISQSQVPLSQADLVDLADTSAEFRLTADKLDLWSQQAGQLSLTDFISQAGNPSQVGQRQSDGQDRVSLIYDNRNQDDTLRMSDVYFVKDEESGAYLLEYVSYYQLSSKAFPEKIDGEFTLTLEDYEGLVLGKSDYESVVADLGQPNQALVSKDTDYSSKRVQLCYVQETKKQVVLIFEEDERGQLLLKEKRQTVWEN